VPPSDKSDQDAKNRGEGSRTLSGRSAIRQAVGKNRRSGKSGGEAEPRQELGHGVKGNPDMYALVEEDLVSLSQRSKGTREGGGRGRTRRSIGRCVNEISANSINRLKIKGSAEKEPFLSTIQPGSQNQERWDDDVIISQ